MEVVIFLIVLLGNVWLWKIFQFSFLIGAVTMLCTVALFMFIRKDAKKYLIFYLAPLFCLIIFTTSWKTLTYVPDEMEKIVIQERLNEYPPITWVPIAYWLEQRKETVAVYKLADNFSEVVDINLYFFANHPRERATVAEIEKFPYILLPFFVLGVFLLVSEGRTVFIISSLFIPALYYSVIGSSSVGGPYLLFPFIAVSITKGISLLKRGWLISFSVLFALVLIQNIIYAEY